MSKDPIAQENAALAHIADIDFILSDGSWYLGLVDGSIEKEMNAVANAIKEIPKGIFLKNYGAQKVPKAFNSTIRVEGVHLIIDGFHFIPGSRRLRVGIAIVAGIVGITNQAIEAAANYPAAKENFSEIKTDVKTISDSLSRKIIEFLKKESDETEVNIQDIIIETSWKRGHKDLGKLLIESAARNKDT